MSEQPAFTLTKQQMPSQFNLPDNLQFKELIINVNTKTQGCSNTRLVQEVGSIYTQCDNIRLTKCNNMQRLEVNVNNNVFVFELCYSYPFKIPLNVYVNGISYNEIMRIKDPAFIPYIKKYLGKECFCCSSLLCADNWTPVIRIASIINEIQFNMIIMHKIDLNLVCDQIRQKYRCNFAMFEEYLF
jgi:hypothetical protein